MVRELGSSLWYECLAGVLFLPSFVVVVERRVSVGGKPCRVLGVVRRGRLVEVWVLGASGLVAGPRRYTRPFLAAVFARAIQAGGASTLFLVLSP